MNELSVKSTRTIRNWILTYQQQGEAALYPVFQNNSYTKEKYMYFYNNERFQERFGYRTPMEVRQNALLSDVPQYPIPVNKRIKTYKEKWIA